MGKVWFISDTHWGHKTLIHDKYRPFKTIEEHDQVLIDNWNSVVSDEDTVFHLGDAFFCDKNRSIEIMNRLKGHKILIKGNHDSRKDSYYYGIGFEEVQTWGYYESFTLTHKPLGFQNKPMALNLTAQTFNVHGHIHKGTHRSDSMDIINQNQVAYYCVSVDQTNFYPISFEEIDRKYNIWLEHYYETEFGDDYEEE